MLNSLFGVSILYYLANQPFDLFRFTYFQIFCMATSLVSQAIGFFLGAWAPVKVCLNDQIFTLGQMLLKILKTITESRYFRWLLLWVQLQLQLVVHLDLLFDFKIGQLLFSGCLSSAIFDRLSTALLLW